MTGVILLKMSVKRIGLTLDASLAEKLERYARKMGFLNSQKYLYELIRRSLHAKGGRPKRLDPAMVDPYIVKFAKPTKKTYQILKSIHKSL